MPRINHTPRSVTLGAYPTLPVVADSLDLVWVVATPASDEQFTITGKEIILAWNTGATPHTITVTSVAIHGRTGDITAYSIGADDIAILPLPVSGFKQVADGKCYFEADNAEVKFAILKIA